MAGLGHLFWLVLFIAVGFPVALAIELYLRAWWKHRASHHRPLTTAKFMRVPEDSAIARRMREPAMAAIPEPE